MTNFVFSRRALQRTVESLAAILEMSQIESLVARLNRHGEGLLPAMWELVVLNSLGTYGQLRHEIELPDGRRPDFELLKSSTGDEPFYIIGDVVTISDAGLVENNPVWELSLELSRLARRFNLNPNHFGYEVASHVVGKRSKLFLPPRGALLNLMMNEVKPWVRQICEKSQTKAKFEHIGTDAKFWLTYDSAQQYQRGFHANYDTVSSPTKNTLYSRLKSKLAQLRNAPPQALRLIIACDGGCSLFQKDRLARSHGTYNAREVAEDFLRQNSGVDAILLVTVDGETAMQFQGEVPALQIRVDLVLASVGMRSHRITATSVTALEMIQEALRTTMPLPVRSSRQAAALCKVAGFGSGMIGALRESCDQVSFSVRALQQLLGGHITVGEFNAAHGWDKDWNPFTYELKSGRLIAKAEVMNGCDMDDDWITLKFGSHDPAIAPFYVPTSGSET
jgi:hypothetical protein